MKAIRVLIIDDSAVVRKLLTRYLSRVEGIEVVGAAPDAYAAREMIVELKPDVLTLDIEMPRMNGLTFLGYLMRSYPLPVIILSSLVKEQNELTMQALAMGALDVVPKPGGPFAIGEMVSLLAEKILHTRGVRMDLVLKTLTREATPGTVTLARYETTNKLIAIGASTGGTIALEKILPSFSEAIPPVLVVIHMPQGFTHSFARRLDSLTRCRVKEGEQGERLRPGIVYIAPGNYHMELQAKGSAQYLKIFNGPKVNSCRPAVDLLFQSLARESGKNACGVLLTGMGKDGAQGLLKMKEAGGYTIAQDESTSIVFGMPKEAIDRKAHRKVLPLMDIIPDIEKEFLNKSKE